MHVARDGEEALEQVRNLVPNICILDVMMPNRNGYEICEIIKGDPDLRHIHVILLTAKGQESAKQRGLDAGADEYMTKPFSPTRIVERVCQILHATGELDLSAGEEAPLRRG